MRNFMFFSFLSAFVSLSALSSQSEKAVKVPHFENGKAAGFQKIEDEDMDSAQIQALGIQNSEIVESKPQTKVEVIRNGKKKTLQYDLE